VHNVALKVEQGSDADKFLVSGRGELHLSVLIENMRREGYELAVSRPEVIIKEIDGQKMEPIEQLVVDVEEIHQGPVMERLGVRKGQLKNMESDGKGRVRLEYQIPARGLIGFQNQFKTLTQGSGLLFHVFDHYGPKEEGQIAKRLNGVMIANAAGTTPAYSLGPLQDRGKLFAAEGDSVYEGQLVGIHAKDNDLTVNAIKPKPLTNMRASGKDDAIQLTPAIKFSLEQALDFIDDDELVEITPRKSACARSTSPKTIARKLRAVRDKCIAAKTTKGHRKVAFLLGGLSLTHSLAACSMSGAPAIGRPLPSLMITTFQRRARRNILSCLLIAAAPLVAVHADDAPLFVPQWLGAQYTFVDQNQSRVHSPYSGPLSLNPNGSTARSHTFGAYFGIQLPERLQFYLDVEMFKGEGVSGATGLAGLTNGDIIRSGVASLGKRPYIARTYLRWTVSARRPDDDHRARARSTAGRRSGQAYRNQSRPDGGQRRFRQKPLCRIPRARSS
jgi:hypothetical protein